MTIDSELSYYDRPVPKSFLVEIIECEALLNSTQASEEDFEQIEQHLNNICPYIDKDVVVSGGVLAWYDDYEYGNSGNLVASEDEFHTYALYDSSCVFNGMKVIQNNTNDGQEYSIMCGLSIVTDEGEIIEAYGRYDEIKIKGESADRANISRLIEGAEYHFPNAVEEIDVLVLNASNTSHAVKSLKRFDIGAHLESVRPDMRSDFIEQVTGYVNRIIDFDRVHYSVRVEGWCKVYPEDITDKHPQWVHCRKERYLTEIQGISLIDVSAGAQDVVLNDFIIHATADLDRSSSLVRVDIPLKSLKGMVSLREIASAYLKDVH